MRTPSRSRGAAAPKLLPGSHLELRGVGVAPPHSRSIQNNTTASNNYNNNRTYGQFHCKSLQRSSSKLTPSPRDSGFAEVLLLLRVFLDRSACLLSTLIIIYLPRSLKTNTFFFPFRKGLAKTLSCFLHGDLLLLAVIPPTGAFREGGRKTSRKQKKKIKN